MFRPTFSSITFMGFTLIVATLSARFAVCEESKSTSLFNGRDLTGWHVDVPDLDKDPDADATFVVRDGLLVSLGQPGGHLITDAKYGNYRLEVEYRFAAKPGNCGVLVHASIPRALYKMFPKSIEVQMNSGHAGDFWCIGEDITVPDMVKRRGPQENWGVTEGKGRRILNLTDNSEKPPGEWNTMVIECVADAVKVWVNGDLVNHGTKCTATSGQIALQAEGSEVEFRKLELTPLSQRPLPDLKVGQPMSLFDGKTLKGWTTQDGKPVTDGWIVEDGAIYRAKRGGNIFYEQEVGDFELTFQWKIVAGGNNGLKYRVRKYDGRMLGCEYQLLGEKGRSLSKGSCGALYELYEPNEKKQLNPIGEWNTAKIVVHGPRIEHWMNGEKIVEADLASDEWYKRLAKSKFAPHQDFARNTLGRIMLTDHGSQVWYRDLVLTPLPNKEIPPLPKGDTGDEITAGKE